MLVKVNSITVNNSSSGRRKRRSRIRGRIDEQEEERGQQQYSVRVTKLDIDDLGSIIPLKELELEVPPNDESIVRTLKESRYAAIFTEGDNEERGSTIILANSITEEELNKDKEKTIDRMNEAQ